MTDETDSGIIVDSTLTEDKLKILPDLSRFNCLHFGSFTSLIYDDPQEVKSYTNIQLAQEAARLAAGLHSLGVQQGDRVIVIMQNCPEVPISYQAIGRLGAQIIPVLPLLKPPEIHYIAVNSGAKAIITSDLLLPLLQHALKDVNTLHHLIVRGNPGNIQTLDHAEVHPYQSVLATEPEIAQTALEPIKDIVIRPEDTAVILYTSGTTGRPKGVELTHNNLVQNALSSHSTSEKEPAQDVQLGILPLAHAFGIVALNVIYLSGAQLVMQPRFDPQAVLSAIQRYHVSSFAGVPAMFVALLYTPDIDKYDISSLQYCVSGSAPLPIAVLKGFEQKFGCRILEGYGLSEASAVLTGHAIDMPQRPGSVGKPVKGVEVQVVDENDQPLPVGEIGEVVAQGPNIMRGYYNMPEDSSSALRNGWLHTGDMGKFDEDGYLYIVERKKDLIIRGGFNIYPRDVEEVLNSHPAVVESAVVGIPSERMGEDVMAYVVISKPVDAETLMVHCRESLANYKTPSRIEFVDSLPRNGVGKIDKKELRKKHVN